MITRRLIKPQRMLLVEDIPYLYHPGRIAKHHRPGGDIACDHRAGRHNRSITDGHSGIHKGAGANPCVGADGDRLELYINRASPKPENVMRYVNANICHTPCNIYNKRLENS